MIPGLSVYKVQKDGESWVKILHHNILLPLVAPEDSTDNDPEPVDLDSTNAGDDGPYVGPITRSRAKAQDSVFAHTNTWMDEYSYEGTGGFPCVSSPSAYHFFDLRRGWNAFFLWFK